MLTSFFSKSNPINYLILGIFIFTGYFLGLYVNNLTPPELGSTIEQIVFGIVCVFSMLLLDFMIRKNRLSMDNTYGIFFFSCFIVSFPAIFLAKNLIIAVILVLLAIRRILSLRTELNIEKKILDAAIWITLASFLYFWSLLFFFVLYFALTRNSNINYRHYLIPVAGFFGIFVIVTSYYFVIDDSFHWFYNWKSPVGLDFSAYNKLQLLLPATIVIALLIWTGISRVFTIGSLQKKVRPNAVVVLITVVVSVFVALASPHKTGAEILFILPPLAVVSTNYIEKISEFWFKEVIMWIIVLIPIVVIFL